MIRPAGPGDRDAIRDCARAAYALYLERIGREPAPMIADFARSIEDGQAWVMTDDDRVLGYVVFYPRGDHLHLENVAIWPDCQGRGLGGRLIAFVEQEARRRGLAAVELYTNEKMTENLRLYPGLGFVEIDRRTEDGFDRVYFRKTLAP